MEEYSTIAFYSVHSGFRGNPPKEVWGLQKSLLWVQL